MACWVLYSEYTKKSSSLTLAVYLLICLNLCCTFFFKRRLQRKAAQNVLALVRPDGGKPPHAVMLHPAFSNGLRGPGWVLGYLHTC